MRWSNNSRSTIELNLCSVVEMMLVWSARRVNKMLFFSWIYILSFVRMFDLSNGMRTSWYLYRLQILASVYRLSMVCHTLSIDLAWIRILGTTETGHKAKPITRVVGSLDPYERWGQITQIWKYIHILCYSADSQNCHEIPIVLLPGVLEIVSGLPPV